MHPAIATPRLALLTVSRVACFYLIHLVFVFRVYALNIVWFETSRESCERFQTTTEIFGLRRREFSSRDFERNDRLRRARFLIAKRVWHRRC